SPGGQGPAEIPGAGVIRMSGRGASGAENGNFAPSREGAENVQCMPKLAETPAHEFYLAGSGSVASELQGGSQHFPQQIALQSIGAHLGGIQKAIYEFHSGR